MPTSKTHALTASTTASSNDTHAQTDILDLPERPILNRYLATEMVDTLMDAYGKVEGEKRAAMITIIEGLLTHAPKETAVALMTNDDAWRAALKVSSPMLSFKTVALPGRAKANTSMNTIGLKLLAGEALKGEVPLDKYQSYKGIGVFNALNELFHSDITALENVTCSLNFSASEPLAKAKEKIIREHPQREKNEETALALPKTVCLFRIIKKEFFHTDQLKDPHLYAPRNRSYTWAEAQKFDMADDSGIVAVVSLESMSIMKQMKKVSKDGGITADFIFSGAADAVGNECDYIENTIKEAYLIQFTQREVEKMAEAKLACAIAAEAPITSQKSSSFFERFSAKREPSRAV